ncbi:MAG: hypothetical protein RJA44_2053 [Pseudomonadota bacterium]|jgi:hypothetical protein
MSRLVSGTKPVQPPSSVTPMIKTSTRALLTTLLLSAAAQAHEGHGLPGASHWHSTDVIGYTLALGILAALWMTRGK